MSDDVSSADSISEGVINAYYRGGQTAKGAAEILRKWEANSRAMADVWATEAAKMEAYADAETKTPA